MTEELLSFIDKSKTAFHAAAETAEILRENGFTELSEGEGWTLFQGGKYFVCRNQSSLIAFRVTDPEFDGFTVGAAHLDSPCLKLKPSPEIPGDYLRLSIEKYGGLQTESYLDRPLSLAGRAVLRTAAGVKSRLFAFDRDLCVIPSIPMHLKKDKTPTSQNPAIDLLPLYAARGKRGDLIEDIADHLGCRADEILSHDTYVVNREKGRRFGRNGEYIASPRLDDLLCVYPLLIGFIDAAPTDAIPVLALFDNEEVGSLSRQGADSGFLAETLSRISTELGGSESDYRCRMANSFFVSADNAHALHPNHPELFDKENVPLPNEGIVLKSNAALRYTTDAVGAAIFTEICKRNDIPMQIYANRADISGGSTLGSIALRHSSMLAVDIGLAQFSMHAAVESAGALDAENLRRFAEIFFSLSFRLQADGQYEF